MNLTQPSQVRHLLSSLGVKPRKALGQNFLVDRNILDIILTLADPGPSEHILEVGPGLGVVTDGLAEYARKVTAVEKDRQLAEYLTTRFSDMTHVTIHHADMLDVPVGQRRLAPGKGRAPRHRNPVTPLTPIHKVVSNLPYASGSRILAELVTTLIVPQRIVVTLQKEVGDRISAAPGSRTFGILSLWVQLLYEISTCRKVSPTCFWPPPEVDSVILGLTRRKTPLPQPEARAYFYQLTKRAFGSRRKQLAGTLSTLVSGHRLPRDQARQLLEAIGTVPGARPETLDVDEWFQLAQILQKSDYQISTIEAKS